MSKAFIAAGRLYSEDVSVGNKLYVTIGDNEMVYKVSGMEDTDKYLPFRRCFVNPVDLDDQNCLIPDGVCEIDTGDGRQCVLLIGTYRKETCKTELGKPYPFMDRVYPVFYSEKAAEGFEVKIYQSEKSLDREKLPKILADGNKEIFKNIGEMSYAFPTEIISGDPYCLYGTDFTDVDDEKVPLKHNDILEISCSGEKCLTLVWDQISKVWYEPKNSDSYEMIYVKGGRYTMGDYRGKLSNYSFGIHNVNMKKNWENVLDPHYMGEEKIGSDSVGKSGLKESDSQAADKSSNFWCFNEDAVTLHDVEVSDFYLGKYSVTMDEFYLFVSELQEDKDGIYYTSSGNKYYIHEIAALCLSDKMKLPRDNGWGLGQRPAINVCFNEIAEYCNWLSLKNGFEPCYEIKPIFQGEYQNGLSKCSMFRYEENSVMQIKAVRGEMHQLVEITCLKDKNGYRLPYEAEFEYVLRGAGHIPDIRDGKGELYAGISVDDMKYNNDFSWQRMNTDQPMKNGQTNANLFRDNMGGNGYTSPVGAKHPNRFGFYDLSGGVWEIMNDLFSRVYFEECSEKDLIKDPSGPQYSIEQLSDMENVNTDAYLKGRYIYSYEKADDDTYTRTKAVSIEASGKTHHVLRGGCYTNPYLFTSSLHRHAAGGISYIENFVNHYNARTGFRLARNI